jgi:HNH endonuclease domain protein
MTIQLVHIKVRDLFNGYQDNGENGVVAYGGKLDVRPAYQREFIYDSNQQRAVIDTLSKDYPLNVMYWADQGGGHYELIDGQQRTLSICTFLNNDFSCKGLFSIPQSLQFGSLTKDQQDKLLDYELTVYICDGNPSEKLEWFKTINIAGEKLTDQELRNAVYAGPWVSDAKRYFSKTGCAAYGLGSKYLKGTPIRQEYLESVIYWYGDQAMPKLDIEECMMKHQHDPKAQDLWDYFQRVIEWVERLFPTYRKEMKGLPWGIYYNRYHKNTYDPIALEQEIATLMADEDVTKKSGIYKYVLEKAIGNDDPSVLGIRAFSDSQKRTIYEQQGGVCPHCGKKYEYEEMEGDHITPWSKGGKTELENLQMLCQACNRRKSSK